MKVLKLTRRVKEILGAFSLIASAILLIVGFCKLVKRKGGIGAALVAIAAAEGVAGALFLADATTHRRAKAAARRANEEEAELFDDAECAVAEAHIRSVLGGKHDDGEPASILKEIPRDEEASEADFAN